MATPDYTPIIDEFDRHVRTQFAFLEAEYGFTRCSPRTHDLCEPRDAGVSIRYNSVAVSIEIGLSLTGQGIGVNFKNERWSRIPRDQRVKWVSLEAVIAYRANGEAKLLLHELTSSRGKYWPEGFLVENLELVIHALATQVVQHAEDIIRGDVSTFPDIAAGKYD